MSAEGSNLSGQIEQPDPGGSEALAERIRTAALQGEFAEAERLREELIRDDPLNLKLIVATGEVIEQQKTSLLDRDHIAVWLDLYQELSEEETNGLFYSLEPAEIGPSKLLQVQGKMSSRLFFIDSGTVALFYPKEGKNIVVAQLGRGDIVGESSFFEIALCPLSAATRSDVKLYSLTRAAAEGWQGPHPGLYEKLAGFCRKVGRSGIAAAASNLDRRSTSRYQISGTAAAVVLSKAGTETDNRFKGGLSDISTAGVCFEIKCSRQETARALLAKTVDLRLEFDQDQEAGLDKKGQITRVSFHLHNDYSVHVRFQEAIDEATFKSLPCRWPETDAGA